MGRTGTLSPRRAALIAGIGYLVIFVLAIFANFFVMGSLIDPKDPAVTASNIAASLGLFRAGIAAFLVIFVLDIVIAWALYELFAPVSSSGSLLAAWLRIAYAVLLGVALVPLMLVVGTIADPPIPAFAELMASAFDGLWLVGLVLFGVHLVVIGALVRRASFAPSLLGLVLMVAGAAYAFDTLAHILVPSYEAHASVFLAIVAIPSIVAELWFMVWLLVRGRSLSSAV